MTHQKSKLFKASWATAITLTLVSIESLKADSTHFSEKVEAEPTGPQTPLEAKAAEFQKVLQNFEGKETVEANPELTPHVEISETSPIELVAKATEEGPAPTPKSAAVEVLDFHTVQNGRSPIGIIESNRDLPTQKWYLFSSAKRGAENPNDVVEIVSIVSNAKPSHRGEEVKSLLVEMGIKPERIHVIAAKGEEAQVGKIYIFKK